jgi:hypothetical protein
LERIKKEAVRLFFFGYGCQRFIKYLLKIQFSSLCGVARKKLLLTSHTYAAAQFFARTLPGCDN